MHGEIGLVLHGGVKKVKIDGWCADFQVALCGG